MTQVIDEIWEIFKGLGFTRARGPEVETEWYNFVALNTPLDHPAADEQESDLSGESPRAPERSDASTLDDATLDREPAT